MDKYQECQTYWAKIFIAGPKHTAEDVCRQFVERGLCVNVSETNYIFKYGEQQGVVVELINYPRFPLPPDELNALAVELADWLCIEMCQGSYTIQTPTITKFYSRRDE